MKIAPISCFPAAFSAFPVWDWPRPGLKPQEKTTETSTTNGGFLQISTVRPAAAAMAYNECPVLGGWEVTKLQSVSLFTPVLVGVDDVIIAEQDPK